MASESRPRGQSEHRGLRADLPSGTDVAREKVLRAPLMPADDRAAILQAALDGFAKEIREEIRASMAETASMAEAAAAGQAKQLAAGVEHLLQELGAYEEHRASPAALRGSALLKRFAVWQAGDDYSQVERLVSEVEERWNAAVIAETDRRHRESCYLLRIQELEDSKQTEASQYRRVCELLASHGFPVETYKLVMRVADLEMELARARLERCDEERTRSAVFQEAAARAERHGHSELAKELREEACLPVWVRLGGTDGGTGE